MQISAVGLKENLEVAENGQIGFINKKGSVLFENHYQEAAVLEKNTVQGKDYKDTDGMAGQPEEKSQIQLSQEMINQLTDNVTPEDYSAYAQLGLAPEKDDPSVLVTVNDRIKIELAAHCENFEMYGDVNMDAIKQIYGDTGIAYSIASSLAEHNLPVTQENINEVKQALEMAEGIGNISEDSMSYILNGSLPLSVENVYMAEYSNGATENNFNQIKLTDSEWESLRPQAERLLESAGIAISPENLEDARWMIENKIPVTVENIRKMSAMKEFSNSMSEEEWIDSIVSAMEFGGSGKDALITGMAAIEKTAEEFVNVVENVTDEEMQQIIKDNNILNLNNFKIYKKEGQKASAESPEEPEEAGWNKEPEKEESEIKEPEIKDPEIKGLETEDTEVKYTGIKKPEQKELKQNKYGQKAPEQKASGQKDLELIKARRQLEEIRLMMTSRAGIKMLMQGIDIDTEPMENIVNELKDQEQKYITAMFGTVGYVPEENDMDLFKSVTDSMEILKSAPTYVLGKVMSGEAKFEVVDVTEKGLEIKSKLEAAGEAYETMRTQPRKDLGDSMAKAFESVDNILQDIGVQPTESSRRAVRILAYNNMEITEENIMSIKQLDMEVTRLMDNMTPKTTVHLISEGINPLHTDIRELNDKLEAINSEINADNDVKYSEYLWKLQNDSAISEEDRNAYIGIYRLLNMVSKGDRSVIGALVNQGAEITLDNMLSAVRSEKAKGMDIEVDSKAGFAEEIKFDENSVSSQLSGFMENNEGQESDSDKQRYLNQMMQKIFDGVTPQKLSAVSVHGDIFNMTLEELLENMEKYSDERNEEYQIKYYEQCISRMQEMAKDVSEDVFKMLLDSNQMPTVENVMAAAFAMSDNGRMFGRLKKLSDDGEVNDRVKKVSEFDGGEEEIKQSFELFDKSVESAVDKYIMSGGTDNLNELIQLKKSFHILNAMAQKEMYHIPIEINGETAGIRVTIITNGSEKGKVTADIRSDVFGRISAEFNVKGNRVDGIIVADSRSTAAYLEEKMPELENSLREEGYITDGVGSSRLENISYGMWSIEEGRQEGVSNSSLYAVAKIFISNVKEWGKDIINNQ